MPQSCSNSPRRGHQSRPERTADRTQQTVRLHRPRLFPVSLLSLLVLAGVGCPAAADR